MLNVGRVTRIAPYVATGVFIWVCVLKSGVHATMAGVAVGLAIPLAASTEPDNGPLDRLQRSLHPWVAYGILPVFAFANAGVSLAGVTLASLVQPISPGIALGLLLGKPIGLLSAIWLGVRSGLCRLPDGTSWSHMAGVAMLGGIGLTMSLFIGGLAFPMPQDAAAVRIGVIFGSVTAASCGCLWLRRMTRMR